MRLLYWVLGFEFVVIVVHVEVCELLLVGTRMRPGEVIETHVDR